MSDNKKPKLKVFTAFSGYDSQCMALERLKEDFEDFDYELVGWSEIDKPAIKTHNAVFPEYTDRNYGDISKINWDEVPDFDLFTYSSPCQSFSISGKQEGGEEGSGTRSSLLWECRRAIEIKRPKYCVLENVKALVSNKFIDLFNRWVKTVDSFGYKSNWKILNASDYNIPQGRERVFLVSIRIDDDDPGDYYFPAAMERTRSINDFLEDKVDEDFYQDDRDVPKFFDLLNHTGDDWEELKSVEHVMDERIIEDNSQKNASVNNENNNPLF